MFNDVIDKKYIKNLMVGLFSIVFYFVMSYSMELPLAMLGISPAEMPQYLKVLYMTAYQVLLLAILIGINYSAIDDALKDLKKNHKSYFKKYFKFWFLALFLMMISNMIVMTITNTGIAGNEEGVREMFGVYPFYAYLSAVFFAPIVEEIVFRLSIKNVIKYKWPAIIISGLFFGFLHVMGATTPAELLYIIPYSMPGFVFAYVLFDSDNICVPISLHFLHNGILMSLQIILLLFS